MSLLPVLILCQVRQSPTSLSPTMRSRRVPAASSSSNASGPQPTPAPPPSPAPAPAPLPSAAAAGPTPAPSAGPSRAPVESVPGSLSRQSSGVSPEVRFLALFAYETNS